MTATGAFSSPCRIRMARSPILLASFSFAASRVETAAGTEKFRHGGFHGLGERQTAVGHRAREILQGVSDLSTPVIERQSLVLRAECQSLVHQVVGHPADRRRLASYDLGKADHLTSPVCTARTIAAGRASILPPIWTTCSLKDFRTHDQCLEQIGQVVRSGLLQPSRQFADHVADDLHRVDHAVHGGDDDFLSLLPAGYAFV